MIPQRQCYALGRGRSPNREGSQRGLCTTGRLHGHPGSPSVRRWARSGACIRPARAWGGDAVRRTYIPTLLRMAQEMRPYLASHLAAMIGKAHLGAEEAQVLKNLSKDLQDLERLIGRPLFPELYEVKPRRPRLLRPDQRPEHYRGTLFKRQ